MVFTFCSITYSLTAHYLSLSLSLWTRSKLSDWKSAYLFTSVSPAAVMVHWTNQSSWSYRSLMWHRPVWRASERNWHNCWICSSWWKAVKKVNSISDQGKSGCSNLVSYIINVSRQGVLKPWEIHPNFCQLRLAVHPSRATRTAGWIHQRLYVLLTEMIRPSIHRLTFTSDPAISSE